MSATKWYYNRYARGGQNSVLTKNLADFYSEAPDTPAGLLQNSKEQILDDFLRGFKAKQKWNSDPRLDLIGIEQLKALLKEHTSVGKNKGKIGEELGNELAKELQNKILTGSALAGNVEEVRLQGGADVDSGAASNAAAIQKELDKIKDAIGGYIDILQNGQDNLLLMKLVAMYQKAGGTFTHDELTRFNGLTLSPTNSMSNFSKVSSALDALSEKIAILQGKANSPFEKLEGLVNSAKKNLNEIGSEGIHESLGAHVTNVVANKVNTDLMTHLDPKEIFTGENWRILSVSNATTNLGHIGKMKGKQQKDDIIITWTNGVYTIDLPVSMKARYSSRNYNISSGKLKGTLHPQGIALGELIDMSFRSRSVLENAWSTWLAEPKGRYTTYMGNKKASFYPFIIQDWNSFKEQSKYSALFRALVGTGIDGDFSALLIVNSSIFSIADILDLSDNSRVVRWKDNPPDFIDIAKDTEISFDDSEHKWPDVGDAVRYDSVRTALKTWYQKKYYIEIQLTNLAMAL